jgi:alpha-N-arabinofuranosidase
MGKCLIIGAIYFGLARLAGSAQSEQTPVLHIKADEIAAKVSPVFSGMMTEEINHSYDGGLYAELIQNRVFKDNATAPVHWLLVQGHGTTASMALDDTNGLNENLGTSLRLEVGSVFPGGRAGVANNGYWGIPVKPKTVYRASFYAKAAAGFGGSVKVDLESTNGAVVFASATVKHLSGDWQKYSISLKTSRKIAPTADACFVLTVNSPGTVWFDLVSLFPPTWKVRPNGNRVDLMQELADMQPAFLRFPGGNYLEGSSIATRFPWKETLGDLAQRPGHSGCWGYRSSDGLGLLEFLEWAEDLKAQPVLAVYAGYSLPPKAELIKPGADPVYFDRR